VVVHVLVVSSVETWFVVRFDSASLFMMGEDMDRPRQVCKSSLTRTRHVATFQPFLLRSASGISAFFSSSFAARKRFTE
jgi:hypothetical protein